MEPTIPGKRISFTVIQRTKAGSEIRYDADRLECVFADGNMKPVLSFVSSGRRMQIPHDEVMGVLFHNLDLVDGHVMGADWCPTCDNRFTHLMPKTV